MAGSDANTDNVPESQEGGTRSVVSGSAGDVVQAREVHGGVHFHGADQPPRSRPMQLPADVRGFVNRVPELARLDEVLAGDPEEPLVARVSIIAGTAGVGKTSLALHWAHRVQHHFPDGSLYANLRGYDPGEPVTPERVLERFLRVLGMPPAAIPLDVEERAAEFRSQLADRRMLVLLDNAATAAQVRPLLPGTAGCLAVVTSRDRLSGLAARDGARRLTVGVLTEPEAVTLLRNVTAGYRRGDDARELVELARLCARLPLALRIAAERAASRSRMPLDDLMNDLRRGHSGAEGLGGESGLWDALTLDDGDEADAVRTVFAWSYRALSEESARPFRLLGLHPGADFSQAAAAALCGIAPSRAWHALDVLVGAHLLEQTAPDRYEFHDLLRAYAADQARRIEASRDCETAVRRVLTWYLHTADAAQAHINPLEPRVALDPVEPGVEPLAFSDIDGAIQWYEAERANLVAATRVAAHAGTDRITWQLHVVLRSIYMDRNPFEDWLTTGHLGLDSARRAGDRQGEAEVLDSLGMAYTQSGRLDQGSRHHRAALEIRRELGDTFGEALTLNGLGLLDMRRRRLEDARSFLEQSAATFREAGDAAWEAVTTANLGELHVELGRYPEAADLLRQALTFFHDHGQRGSAGNALFFLAMAQRESGLLDEASESIREALAIALEQHNLMWEGYWLLEFGAVQRALGHAGEALVSYQRSAALQRRLGDRSREARAFDGAGEAYRDLGRPDEAVAFHTLGVSAHRALGDHWQLALSLDRLARALDAMAPAHAESRERARRHWQEASNLLADFDDPNATSMRDRIAETLEAH